MSSFSCPHFDCCTDECRRVKAECVPGRPGCVLCKNSVFAVPWEERLAAKQRDRQIGPPTIKPASVSTGSAPVSDRSADEKGSNSADE